MLWCVLWWLSCRRACSQVQLFFRHPEQWAQVLGAAIPQTSNFFLNYGKEVVLVAAPAPVPALCGHHMRGRVGVVLLTHMPYSSLRMPHM